MRVFLGLTVFVLLTALTGCAEGRRRKPQAAKAAPVAAKKAEAEPEKKQEAEAKAPPAAGAPAKGPGVGKANGKGVAEHIRDAIGRGETVDIAKKDVLRDAATQVGRLMEKKGLRAFVLKDDFLNDHVLAYPGKAGEDVKVRLGDEDHVFKAWEVSFRTDTDWWSEIVRRDQEAARKVRAEQRQQVGALVIAGLASLLLVGVGYVRFDEYTHRRYTTWLRLAGAGVGSMIAAGWWWVLFQAPG